MNLAVEVQRIVTRTLEKVIFVAVVSSTSAGRVNITRPGQPAADGIFYPTNKNIGTVVNGDRVLCIGWGGTVYVIMVVT